MPKVSKDKGTAWNARQAIAFLRSVRAHRLYAACVLVLVLGLRRSEVLGLRWQDIDFEAGRFTPVKQVQREKGVGLGLKDLKTESSQAVLPLPEFCARVLEERRELQELERKIAGAHWAQQDGHDLIFSSEHGGMIDPTGFSRTFDRLVKRARVRRCSRSCSKTRSSADRSRSPSLVSTMDVKRPPDRWSGGLLAGGANRI
ncbi:tyrosine-type recombinase/integrase [Streptomyces sp. NPDC048251]|uniref:tyrosine-type recombinase/integrase n=1 Tax=Streptomyces sp. NPDC048251 TaxID=3154501 RepID=UPI003447CCF6